MRLGVFRDPEYPLVDFDPVLAELRSRVDVAEITFDHVGHRTRPNRSFSAERLLDGCDALLWLEGGPLPVDLKDFEGPKACWVVHPGLEPTLLPYLADRFDVRFASSLDACADERFRWLPGFAGTRPIPPAGLSVLLADPRPPAQIGMRRRLRRAASAVPPDAAIVACLGQGGEPHPMLFDALSSGAAVVVDPDTDLRGLLHGGEHAEVLPEESAVEDFIGALATDVDRRRRLSSRGPDIVRHLHEPGLRADAILDGLRPARRGFGPATRPRISVLVTCHRYLRRLKVCLESLARQDLPPGSLEVVVADPASPDGLADWIPGFAARHPHLRVVHLPIDGRYRRNRGIGINRAFDASGGEVVIGIDGDLVFPPHWAAMLEKAVVEAPDRIFGVRRVFLDRLTTESILSGAVDPLREFPTLAERDGDGEEQALVGVLGYCQAVHRAAFAKARYPEEYDQVNQSDIVFVERLAKYAGVSPRFLREERVLHLWHPRNWSGTNELL